MVYVSTWIHNISERAAYIHLEGMKKDLIGAFSGPFSSIFDHLCGFPSHFGLLAAFIIMLVLISESMMLRHNNFSSFNADLI